MAQKKDGKPKVAKAAKKAVVKKSAKTATALPATAAPAPPSYILRDQHAASGVSWLDLAQEAWGFLVREKNLGTRQRLVYRQPLFTLTGQDGDRLLIIRSCSSNGLDEFHRLLPRYRETQESVKFFEGEGFDDLRRRVPSIHFSAMLRWVELWGLDNLDCLDEFAEHNDTVLGDILFIEWVELLLMIDEVSDLFRGTNSDIWLGMENASWLKPEGAGLLLLKQLRDAANEDFLVGQGFAPARDFDLIYSGSDINEDELVLTELQDRATAIFGKVLKVLQSPAMESRFKAFFGGLAMELKKSNVELWYAMTDMATSSYGDSSYMPLLRAKVGQVFGLLKDFDETPLTLTDPLEKWVGWIRGEPKGGWPVGPKYEAKANAERLKLIAETQRKERVEAPEPAKKRIF